MNLEETRRDTVTKLAGQVDALRAGQLMSVLGPLAKAYLGLYANTEDIDDPRDRIEALVGAALTRAVLDGFVAALRNGAFPAPADIGAGCVGGRREAAGYVLLAGMDLLTQNGFEALHSLPAATRQAALCFYLADITPGADRWVDALVEHDPALAGEALRAFWVAIMDSGADYLPGFNRFIGPSEQAAVVARAVPPVLALWGTRHAAELKRLLHAALRHADHKRLMTTVARMVEDDTTASVPAQVYWLGTAFLLAPERYGSALGAYVGRSKERALRLLDFVFGALGETGASRLRLSADALAQLLRLIGPKYPPQRNLDVVLDDIDRKVVWLFETLGRCPGPETARALQRLRAVRVMRSCSHVLARAEALHEAAAG